MVAWLPRAVEGVGVGALSDDPVDTCILAAGTAVAWAYAIELNIIIFLRFKRRRGVYFWSLLACSWGICLHALGFILKFLVGSSLARLSPICGSRVSLLLILWPGLQGTRHHSNSLFIP